MAFDDADAYTRFMGRWSTPLAPAFADLAGVRRGDRVLDVGCGPGVLTAVLVDRLGPEQVAAIDPSPQFVEAARARCPGADVRQGRAEALPHPDASYDAVLAQLVVHFMADPLAGLREMGRVARPGGTVAACVWDHGGGTGPLSPFFAAAHDLDPEVEGESQAAGSREGHLVELMTGAGLDEVEAGRLEVGLRFATFEEWWEPFTLGAGRTGDVLARLAAARPDGVEHLREACRALLPPAPFELTVGAWTARGQAR